MEGFCFGRGGGLRQVLNQRPEAPRSLPDEAVSDSKMEVML